jgi:hypothetical protein
MRKQAASYDFDFQYQRFGECVVRWCDKPHRLYSLDAVELEGLLDRIKDWRDEAVFVCVWRFLKYKPRPPAYRRIGQLWFRWFN